jgi:methylmalonyl-CoA mutase
MQASLFSEFENTDKDSWRQRVLPELEGNISKLESWEIAENFLSEPYYTRQEVDVAAVHELHKAQRHTTGWLNLPQVSFRTPDITNTEVRNALSNGANGVFLDLGTNTVLQSELTKTLHNVRLSDHFVFFSTPENPTDLYRQVSNGTAYYLRGGIACDPVATYFSDPQAVAKALEQIASTILKTKVMKDFRPYMVESHLYHDAGADPVQELAFTISSLVQCVDQLTDGGISPLLALNRFFFSISIGTDYLLEIAKLRALRLLYRNISRAYQLPDELCNAFIHVKTSSLTHADKAKETNIIRATIQSMGAVIGGCDAITVASHDDQTEEFGARISRNISLLIDAESYAGYVTDPAAGSYLIDRLSRTMADRAWALFLNVEDRGGILACYKSGFIQNETERSWAKKLAQLKRDRIIVGINKYQEKASVSDDRRTKAQDRKTERALPKKNLADAWTFLST